MKSRICFTLLIISIVFCSCKAHVDPVKLSSVKFNSIFAYSRDSSVVYCLLGAGYYRAPKSNNADSLISSWMKQHPNADLIPVSSINGKSLMIYCWAIDHADTINSWLIHEGCFPGGTMIGIRRGKEDVSDVYVDDVQYENFIEQIKFAEAYARQNKLGVWAKENPIDQ
ncbi:MAG TPA: hypothetical protein VKT28_22225 [Puia sp.]|nr:hypothetical protein [Puia sp.]